MAKYLQACKYRHINGVKLLLEKGYDVNFQDDKYGDTALQYTSRNGYTEIVELLINNKRTNVDCNIQDNNGYTALMFASRENNIEIVKILLNYEKNIDTLQSSINIRNKNKHTALILASYNGNTEIVKLLLEEGADPNLQDKNGNTALINASRNSYTKIVKLLLKKGANPDLQNKEGVIALNIAFDNGYIDIVKLLGNYISFRKNIENFIPSYNILLLILIRSEEYRLPNEMVLLIKEYGMMVCGRELFR